MVPALALLLAVQAAPSLPPVDESANDPTLVPFLANLQRAVQRRDAAGLIARVDPNVRLDFGGGGGVPRFRSQWKPGNPDSPVWRELETILKMGGAFEGATYWMPTAFIKWPEKYDAFEYAVATGPTVPVRTRADDKSDVIVRLNYSIVKVQPEQKGWIPVELEDGKKGFARKSELRRPIDYRIAFTKSNGRWLITALIAGD